MSQLGFNVGSYYFNKKLVHMKNECVYIVNSCLSILDQLQIDVHSNQ
jgi:hypothetical protein